MQWQNNYLHIGINSRKINNSMAVKEQLEFAKIVVKDQAFKVNKAYQMAQSGKNSMTKDPAYNAANPNHFIPMMDEDRYGERSDAFDKIISATHKHFWDPNDTKYIDYSEPFDSENNHICDPRVFCMELRIPSIADKLDEKQKIKLSNESFRWVLSQILHGEQGALSLSASLCHVLKDPGAQEYAANQTREEARHVLGFTKYIEARWGKPYRVGPTLGRVLNSIVSSDLVYKKIVGMQMLIEGLAMGAFAMAHEDTNDPLLKRLLKYTMSDEAFHHKFGKIWADRTIPKLSKAEHNKVEDWSEGLFTNLLFNLVNPWEKKEIYESVGLDHKWVAKEFVAGLDRDEIARNEMKQQNNIFRVLVKTLLKAHIITDRTKSTYAQFVDMEELHQEDDEVAGTDIANKGIKILEGINK
tara:strand:+ start:1716 stop:2954 length:1239 start_codon:yes stop_codon:yes gene_type:complete